MSQSTTSATRPNTDAAMSTTGKERTVFTASGECWLGTLLVASSEKGLCAVLLGDNADTLLTELQQHFPDANIIETKTDDARVPFNTVHAQVQNPSKTIDFDLDITGTPFQKQVWDALLAIPAGSTKTYTELAQSIGSPKAVRAVANACGANMLAIIIPCHRAVRRDGHISGYRCGVERKRQLLIHEGARSVRL